MHPATTILIFGTVLLLCGSMSLLVVRWANPQVRGVGLLSGAFLTGALAAGLLSLGDLPRAEWRPVSVLGADLSLLLSFMLLHVAVLRLMEGTEVRFWHGGILLGLQALVDGFALGGVLGVRARITSLSLLVAVQSFSTAGALWHLARRRVRTPATFNALICALFGLFNLVRAVGQCFFPKLTQFNKSMSLVAFALFLAVALGLAFGFFWMTTSDLVSDLEEAASTDPLTRLFNRRHFLRWCEKEMLRSLRTGVPFSLLMVDLDHFKVVNDQFGHQTGDQVLCAAVEQMQDSVRGIDVLCRWGGEEFAVLLPNASREAARVVAERIRENVQTVTLADKDMEGDEEVFQITVSIGAATYQGFQDGISSMLQRADRALYEAKGAGRNRVLLAS